MNSKDPNAAKLAVFKMILGIGLVSLGILGAVSLATKEFRLALFGETAMGIVNKVEEITTSTSSRWEYRDGQKVRVSSAAPSYFMTIGFTTKEGSPVEVRTLATFQTEARVGDEHPVVYLPSQPKNAKISTLRQLWLPMITGIIFTTVCLGLGGWLLFKKSAPQSAGALRS
jgi:hypothetical protein